MGKPSIVCACGLLSREHMLKYRMPIALSLAIAEAIAEAGQFRLSLTNF